METIIKDLNLINQNLNLIPGEFADSNMVSDAIDQLELLGDIQNIPALEKEQLTFLKEGASYSLPCEFLPYAVKRFRQKLIKTEKQILSRAIKQDKRHLKYVLWFEIVSFLKKRSVPLNIERLNKYKKTGLKDKYCPSHLPIENFTIKVKDGVKELNKGMYALEFVDISAFIQFYKEQTK